MQKSKAVYLILLLVLSTGASSVALGDNYQIEKTKANTVIPDVTFKQAMTISLGDSMIELRHHGSNDGRGSISILFKPEKVLFVVDWIVLGRMPWQKLWSYDIQGMINSTKEVLNLDFDLFIGGHADIGTKSEVRRYHSYLDTFYLQYLLSCSEK